MTREETIQYWEQFDAEIDDIYDTASEEERAVLEEQRKMVEFTISALRQQELLSNSKVVKSSDMYDEDGREIPINAQTMTLDDAIAHLDDTLSDTSRKWSCESCRFEHAQLREWLAELRDIKQKRNAPLTLDELRKMDGEPVWVVWPDGRIKSQWFIISSTFWIEMFQEWDGTLSKDYGKTWLAYRQKPEEKHER